LKIALIGDIVGKPGRYMVKKHLANIRKEHNIDFVIANYENASHGFGLTSKNATELLNANIDVMTGGNHTWDKREISSLLQTHPILRPHNYPPEVPGTGIYKSEVYGEKIAVISLMGQFTMPQVDNPFRCAKENISALKEEGYNNIFIDFHAEATAEKRTLMAMFNEDVTTIVGTHTHIGTDDLEVENGCAYVTDIGLSGCRDNIIGMDKEAPIKRAMTGMPSKLDIPSNCKKILQVIVVEVENAKAINAYKIKAYDDNQPIVSMEAIK
jgi:metallophosphoesterase (TIGR00282 family)